ncbi:synaptic vesicle membrane protein VAT-1 homolog [Planococcus citri]|uniref:synaptic vesicle membrane protein VAT-1 homolog n=1 Tax=Planococcus citri TaxID=170843 RepID=UPI0031F8041C
MNEDDRLVDAVTISQFGGFDKIKFTKLPLKSSDCGENDIEVKVKYCGVNFADLYVRQGLIQNIKLPHVPGLECMGIINKVGNKVVSFEVGQRVLCYNGNGGLYREVVVVNEKNCFAVPDHVQDEIAVCLSANYLTAYFCLFDIGNLKQGQNVLIHSCGGGVGWAATQLARSVGKVCIVGTASPSKFSEVENNGVEFLIPSQNYLEELQNHSVLKSKKFDVIIDTVGGSNIANSQALLEPLGKLIVIGVNHIVTGEEKFSIVKLLKLWWQTKNISVSDLITNNAVVAGLHLTNLMEAKPEKVRQTMDHIFDLCKSGVIRPRIDSIYSFPEIAEAMKKLANRENIGKVIVKI